MSEKTDLKSMTMAELTDFVAGTLGEKKFRARQIYEWIHIKHASSFEEMSSLSKPLRTRLESECTVTALQIVQKYVSGIDGTAKYLFELEDGHVIESVLMRYHHGNSVCISSQVGCRMGCRFCASTLDGLRRQLRSSEMLDQIYRISRDIGERLPCGADGQRRTPGQL